MTTSFQQQPLSSLYQSIQLKSHFFKKKLYLFFSHIFHHFTKIFNSKQLEYQGEVDQNQAKRTQGFRSQDSVNLKKGQQEGVKVVLLGADYILIRYSSHMLQSVYKCSLSLTLMTVHFSLSLIYSNRAYIMNELSWRPPLHLGHLVYPNHRGAGPLCAVSLLLLISEGLMLPTCCSLELNSLYIQKGQAPSSSGVQFF